jgi:DNA-binding MarR family transcriptional regulator
MHHMFFQIKRSYWGIQNKLRKPLKVVADGITPARVDMLYALEHSRWERHKKEQRQLSTKLGVVKSVVSRMLRSMERRGWITRQKDHEDRRLWIVTVTDAGKQLLEYVLGCFYRSGTTQHWMHRALMGELWRDRGERLRRLMTFDGTIQCIRDWFRGAGTLYYPWGHPDD